MEYRWIPWGGLIFPLTSTSRRAAQELLGLHTESPARWATDVSVVTMLLAFAQRRCFSRHPLYRFVPKCLDPCGSDARAWHGDHVESDRASRCQSGKLGNPRRSRPPKVMNVGFDPAQFMRTEPLNF